jgi:GT2 family glycosyltransferase
MAWWNRNDIRQVDVVTGCFMLVRQTTIEQIGPMDDEYFMYAEETDWCWRFKKAGWKNLFYPDAKIIHLGGQSSMQIRSKSLIQLRLGILQFFYKNKSRPYYILAGILISFFFLFRIPLWWIMSIMKKSNSNAQTRVKAYSSAWYKVLKVTFIPKMEDFKV